MLAGNAHAVDPTAVGWVGVGSRQPPQDGAPAGLGVREAILVATLSGSIGPTAAVTAAIAHRLLSAAVDAGAFAAGVLLLSQSENR